MEDRQKRQTGNHKGEHDLNRNEIACKRRRWREEVHKEQRHACVEEKRDYYASTVYETMLRPTKNQREEKRKHVDAMREA